MALWVLSNDVATSEPEICPKSPPECFACGQLTAGSYKTDESSHLVMFLSATVIEMQLCMTGIVLEYICVVQGKQMST